jgi:hypothetical protein
MRYQIQQVGKIVRVVDVATGKPLFDAEFSYATNVDSLNGSFRQLELMVDAANMNYEQAVTAAIQAAIRDSKMTILATIAATVDGAIEDYAREVVDATITGESAASLTDSPPYLPGEQIEMVEPLLGEQIEVVEPLLGEQIEMQGPSPVELWGIEAAEPRLGE